MKGCVEDGYSLCCIVIGSGRTSVRRSDTPEEFTLEIFVWEDLRETGAHSSEFHQNHPSRWDAWKTICHSSRNHSGRKRKY
jgi:hypothetical protein